VDPQRVYLLGYSAGGDGVYQLAPRMADRWAAAAMMAGHPNETRPDGLRNLPFALHMGANDGAYDRNKIAGQWKGMLAELAKGDPGAYVHQVVIHEGKGHWMDRQDAVALAWMADHSRSVHPKKIVWLQDDVTHRNFYWLEAEEPKAGARLVAECQGQTIRILEAKDAGALVAARVSTRAIAESSKTSTSEFGETPPIRLRLFPGQRTSTETDWSGLAANTRSA
jgi:hypothetical protein